MHDIKFIRENKESFDNALRKRGLDICSEEVILIDSDIRSNQTKIQKLQYDKKRLARQIAQIKTTSQEGLCLKDKGATIKNEIYALEQENRKKQQQLTALLQILPNIPLESVPYGREKESSDVIRSVGKPKNFHFEVRSHYDIGLNLGMMDFESAVKISGARFVLLKKDLVRLERSLVEFMINIHTQNFGYEEVLPPALVLESTMYKAGQLPKFETESFKTTNNYRLIPTSEVPLVCIHSEEILDESRLPIRYVGYTQCFRSEAGSAGRDTKGMIRQHQFSKVELVSFVKPEESKNELERMTNAAETVLKNLDLPYRVSLLCAEDMGFCAEKTYDIEVWLPYEKKYREISSCSSCGDFQARRMKGRYKSAKDSKNYFFHTLNGSGLALGRTIVAILENYQNEDGTITIPKKLQPFMQNQKIIKCVN